ncbi:lipopolysaccharide biosynthesis protein [Rubritalea marina]|uniref:lipopolysaccharide biosynthesis protein n=1 Tax=Rubritalea marina TaxID=361055 RepID=UPI00039D207E|nr:oligosaccharide flippase family protein [Rubritalea marina]
MSLRRERFLSTTLSGYVALLSRMITGLVMFRLMFTHFSEAEFGFWMMLWSLFGYGVLLDFGFGFTAQKAVASKTATGETGELNKLLATIFWTFIGLAVGLFSVFFVIQGQFLSSIKVSSTDFDSFKATYLVFFGGLALMFPLGLFPEILRGLKRIDIVNWIQTVSILLNFACLYWGLEAGWEMAHLMFVSVLTTALPSVVAAVVSMRKLPELSLSPRWFNWSAVKSQLGFSVAAYLITFGNMIMGKSDQLVISMTLGVAIVAIYQTGFKASEMLGLFGSQVHQILSPAAASMHALGDHSGLRQLFLDSSRITFLMLTPCYLLAAAYLEPLINLLTGSDPVPKETFWVGQALLFATYSSQITNGASKRILMMCDEQKKLLKISLIDAALNLSLSIFLALQIGVLGVALGTFIPTVLVGWLWVIPVTMRKLNIPLRELIGTHIKGFVMPMVAFVVVLGGIQIAFPASIDCGLVGLGWRGLACMLPFLFLSRREILQLVKGK